MLDSWVSKIPWRRKWQRTPIILPKKSHRQRNLRSYSSCDLKVGHNFATKQQQILWRFFQDVVYFDAAAAKSLQLCPTLCDPIDGTPPGSPVPGILQARTLEWVAISFSNAWKWKVKVKLLSRVQLLATPWTAAYQAPPSMRFSRQEYWSGVPLPSSFLFIAE